MISRSCIAKIKDEFGISAIANSPFDTHVLLLARAFRMFAYGSSTLILALYFSSLGQSDFQIGLFMTLTLVGDVVISLLLTFVADTLGRRRILLLGALLMAFSGAVFATTSSYWILLLAAIIGVISPSGNEIGPFRAVEESTLAHLTPHTDRSDVFAWYVVVGSLGTSVGALSAGWMVEKLKTSGWELNAAYRAVFWMYTFIGLLKAALTLLLSERCESQPAPLPQVSESRDDEESEAFLGQQNSGSSSAAGPQPPPKPKNQWGLAQISRESRNTLMKLCCLFGVDSLASGMASISLTSYFISTKFGVAQSTLGTIVSVASLMASIGNIFASSISKRIGFVRTMVFTHLPSAVFLMFLPLPHSLALTIVFLVLRASLATMDEAPRSAFLSAIVLPTERTAVMGVVNTLKTMAQSGGPLLTGLLAGKGRFWVAFTVAGALKVIYDLGMLVMFAGTKVDKNADDAKDAARDAQDAAFGESDVVVEDDEEEGEEPIKMTATLGRGRS